VVPRRACCQGDGVSVVGSGVEVRVGPGVEDGGGIMYGTPDTSPETVTTPPHTHPSRP
jgi:hypothetical protein